MVNKLDQQTFTSEFASHWVPHSYGQVNYNLSFIEASGNIYMKRGSLIICCRSNGKLIYCKLWQCRHYCMDFTIWTNKTHEEKARLELHKNDLCCFENILEAEHHITQLYRHLLPISQTNQVFVCLVVVVVVFVCVSINLCRLFNAESTLIKMNNPISNNSV